MLDVEKIRFADICTYQLLNNEYRRAALEENCQSSIARPKVVINEHDFISSDHE